MIVIKIFFHVAAMNNFGAIKDEIFSALEKSGLMKAAGEVYVNFAHDKRLRLKLPPVAQVTESRLLQFEFPTLQHLHDNARPGDRILYVHTKGVARPTRGGDEWRRYLIWGCIERWRECVAALDAGHDTAGVLLIDAGAFARKTESKKIYAGNFWWATGDYVRRLARPEESDNRWRAEGWIFSGAPNAKSLHCLSGGKLVTALPDKHNFSFDAVTRRDYDDTIPRARPRVKSRIEIINHLIHERKYKSYCEIGVEHGRCFNAVQCARKVSVDPAAKIPVTWPVTSDEFFATCRDTFDIFFIDGLHTDKQVERDIVNALARLNPGGMIVCHDCNPETEFEQRDADGYDGNGVWVGTVWRAWARLRMTRADLRMGMIDTDFGVGVIERGRQEVFPPAENLDWKFYRRNRERLMHVIEPEDFFEWTKRRS